MSPQDIVEFSRAFRTLAASYRGKVPSETEVDAYWQALQDKPLPWVVAALKAAPALYPRFMPTSGEVLAAGRQVDTDASRRGATAPAMTQQIAEGERVCLDCDDTGWVITERPCAEVSPHYHADATRRWARVCPCRPRNAIYQAKRARESRSTAARGDAA